MQLPPAKKIRAKVLHDGSCGKNRKILADCSCLPQPLPSPSKQKTPANPATVNGQSDWHSPGLRFIIGQPARDQTTSGSRMRHHQRQKPNRSSPAVGSCKTSATQPATFDPGVGQLTPAERQLGAAANFSMRQHHSSLSGRPAISPSRTSFSHFPEQRRRKVSKVSESPKNARSHAGLDRPFLDESQE